MIQHYLKTTFRYLKANKIFSAINLFGLAIAICVVYFTLLFVNFELSYDKFHTKGDRIYRLSTDIKTEKGVNYETTSASMAEALEASFPEIETATRIFLDYYIVQNEEDENFGEETLAYADETVFSVFSFPLIRGNAATVLNAPYTLVLSETAAKKYFGTTDCLNKTLTLDGTVQATVTGVMKDIPVNAHFRTDIFLSMSSLIKETSSWTDWSRFGFSTYLLLKKDVNVNDLQKKLTSFVKEHPLKEELQYSLLLEPLKRLYLHGEKRVNKAGGTAVGNYKNIYIFSIVAVFVLFIACFNFINLSTALSLKRAKEIGVKKVMGASKKQLILQFLTDALILSLFAFIGSVLLCILALPWFNELVGKTVSSGIFDNIRYLGIALLIAIFTALLSGIYPAVFLSDYEPITSLKGVFKNSAQGLSLRRALVVTQFVVFTVLTIATLIVYKQLSFMQNERLGFKKAHNLVIDFHYDDRIRDHVENVKTQFMNLADVQSVSISSAIPGRPNKKFPVQIENAMHKKQVYQWDAYFIDHEFLRQNGIEIIAGRAFSEDFPGDLRRNMLINESAVKELGFTSPNDALGKEVLSRGNSGLIVGVVKDFQFHSLHEGIKPLSLQISPGFFTFLTLSISSDNLQATIQTVEKKWASIAPGLPLVYSFSDETFNDQYLAEQRFGKLFICFATLAILISCMGLLGLVSFNTLQRTKEVGIRKVLGASAAGIVNLLTKEYIVLVISAIFIASPIAWWIMNKWLQDFAYRIEIQWWMFALSGLVAVVIAMLTVSFQAVKAAIANPVDSLRDE